MRAGSENHVKVDASSKFILSYCVSDAAVHDSQMLPELVSKLDAPSCVWADSAYSGKPIAEHLESLGMWSMSLAEPRSLERRCSGG